MAADGYVMFPTTVDPDPSDNLNAYKPGNPVNLAVNSQRDGKGSAGTFSVYAPGMKGPVSSGIKSAKYDPATAKASLRMAPETGSRVSRTVKVCADKMKC